MDKLMNQKEVKRAQVLDMLKENKISQQEAAKQMDVSPRQVRRMVKRYQLSGLDGLIRSFLAPINQLLPQKNT